MADQNASPPLLPFWATIENTYKAVWFYRGEYLKIVWCWLLIAIGVTSLYSWYNWSTLGDLLCPDLKHLPDFRKITEGNPHPVLTSLPQTLLPVFFGAPIAVAWHRLILRHEKVATTHYLRFDKVVLNYLFFAVFIMALSYAPLLFTPTVNNTAAPSFSGMMVTWPFVTVILIVLSIRYSVILPAKALEVPNVTLKTVLEKTSWNFWRLFWGSGMACLPGVLLSSLFIRISCSGPLSYMISAVDSMLGFFIMLPFEFTFLSLAYQHFFEREQQSLPQKSGFPIKTIVFTLLILSACVPLYFTANILKDIGSGPLKEIADCNDTAHPDTSLQACTAMINAGVSDPKTYTARAVANLGKKNIDQGMDDLSHAIALKPDYFPALLLRGETYFSQGRYSDSIHDLDPALQAYNALKANKLAADKLHDTIADLYWNRGMAKFYAVSPAAAVDDLVSALQMDPSNAYKVIWLHLAHIRAGQDDQLEFTGNSTPLAQDKWPAPIVALYLGKLSYAEVYARARLGDATAQQGQTCEANFYSGELYLQKNMKDDAAKAFTAADKDCPADFVEGGTARAELKNLGSVPAPAR